jgi:hypothetical protein
VKDTGKDNEPFPVGARVKENSGSLPPRVTTVVLTCNVTSTTGGVDIGSGVSVDGCEGVGGFGSFGKGEVVDATSKKQTVRIRMVVKTRNFGLNFMFEHL